VTGGIPAGDRVDAVRRWRDLLESVTSLSPRYRGRYAIVLAQLETGAGPGALRAARSAVLAGEAAAASELLTGFHRPALAAVPALDRPAVEGTGPVADVVRHIAARRGDLCRFAEGLPPLEQTWVPLHPSRQARSVREDGRELVALRWAADSLPKRRANQGRMAALLRTISAPVPIVAHDDYAVVPVAGEDPWVFAPNLGRTVEDRLRQDDFPPAERDRLVRSLAELRAAMASAGLWWQGFAPRNIFFQDGRLVLIDFEEVVDATADPVRAAECALWHRVFFADCLTDDDTAVVFVEAAAEPVVEDDRIVPADGFERALLGRPTVSWRERRELLGASASLEGRHRRPSTDRDGGALFGHELGHFWGDFLPAEQESALFRGLRTVSEPEILVACLEVFEAAMEADVCRTLRRRAAGETDLSAPRTAALVETLDAAGAGRLASERRRTPEWYEQLSSDPAALVDRVIHAAADRPDAPGSDPVGTLLVGDPRWRRHHEATLGSAVRVGLDFLHREDEPFLRYREPPALRELASRPLPTDGADIDAVLADVENVIARYSVAQSHRDYLAFPDTGNAVAAVAGSLLGRLLNQNLIAVDRSAPAATFVEIQVVEWLRELVGYESVPITAMRGVRDVAGLWATGGHLSNHIAMLVALGQRFPEFRRHGLAGAGVRPGVVLSGPIAHYSHSDAAFHLGLGWDAVIPVGADDDFTTDPAAVEKVLADPPSGVAPFMVVGVAGNCRTTGLDDLAELADVCRRHGVWFHVDACHGGSLIFSQRLRDRHLAGISNADSVALDPHKGLFTPYPSSYVLFRERGVLTQFSRHEKTVNADGCWDLGLITPFLGSRGFESLATWMLINHVGVTRLGDLVEGRQAQVRYLARRIDDTDLFVRLNDVDFYRLTFVFCPMAARRLLAAMDAEHRASAAQTISRYTSRLNSELYQAGAVCFDEHTLADLGDRVGAGSGVSYVVAAACPGNPLLTRSDLDRAVDRLTAAARRLLPELLADLADSCEQDPRILAGPAGWGDLSS
jgi:glutamate/tyrosine decarboxylase-like PLP-dependent enzyme